MTTLSAGATNIFTNGTPQLDITGDLSNGAVQITIGWALDLFCCGDVA